MNTWATSLGNWKNNAMFFANISQMENTTDVMAQLTTEWNWQYRTKAPSSIKKIDNSSTDIVKKIATEYLFDER